MPNANSYNAITVQNQVVYNTPWFQRVHSSNPPLLEEEIENKITQLVSDGDIERVPSSNAVHDFVTDLFYNIAIPIIDEIVENEHLKVPSSDAIYQELLKKANLDLDNVFNGDNTFNNPIQSLQSVDIYDDNSSTLIPNSESVKNFVSEVLSDETVKFNFISPSLEWVINHNRNTDIFQENVRDINHKPIYASLDIVDANTFKVKFTEQTSGYVIVRF